MNSACYPSLYQINTRVWLTELSRKLGRAATLDDIPDAELDRLAQIGFDWIWFLSVWQTGLAAQQVSRSNSEWRKEFQETLPDLKEEDIGGSGFAIQNYTVHRDLGGDAALKRRDESADGRYHGRLSNRLGLLRAVDRFATSDCLEPDQFPERRCIPVFSCAEKGSKH
jgi:hypothetical protein